MNQISFLCSDEIFIPTNLDWGRFPSLFSLCIFIWFTSELWEAPICWSPRSLAPPLHWVYQTALTFLSNFTCKTIKTKSHFLPFRCCQVLPILWRRVSSTIGLRPLEYLKHSRTVTVIVNFTIKSNLCESAAVSAAEPEKTGEKVECLYIYISDAESCSST